MIRNGSRLKAILIYTAGILIILSLFAMDVAKESLFGRFDKAMEPGRVQNAVRFYNRALEKAISENKTSYLEEYATSEAQQRVSLYISYEILERKTMMEPKLISLNIERHELKGNKATVWTNEKWQTAYYDSQNRAQMLFAELSEYKMEYKLVKQKKNWLVSDIRILRETKKPVEK